MPYVIASPCIDVTDKSCTEECPVDCIYEGDRKLYINPKECIDCGACEPVCPVEAISQDRRVAEEDHDRGLPRDEVAKPADLARRGQDGRLEEPAHGCESRSACCAMWSEVTSRP